ncbi:MAG TPA: hypothetical protein VFI47_04965 [Acidimicrobiales bacterium]|nr:hypothetical protein [Acidimicrobiales bacterium]
MAAEIGASALDLVEGERRWVTSHDRLAGRASMLEARALMEFLVGRSDSRPADDSDVLPQDYVSGWTMAEEHVERLRLRIGYLDQRLVHLSLARVDDPPDPPAGWHMEVEFLVGEVRRFADAMVGVSALAHLLPSLREAERLLAGYPWRPATST